MPILHHKARGVYPARTHNSTPITVNHRGRTIIIGQVIGDTLTKRVQASKHFLRTPPAICLDAKTIIDAEQVGAVNVAITDTETSRTYTASLALFKSKCFRVKRGDGQQLGLTLNYWSINGHQSEVERQEQAAAIKADAASYQQPALFDMADRMGAFR